MSIADYIYIISDGEIIESGTPDGLRNSSSEWVQQFLNGYPDGPTPFHYPAPEYITRLIGESLILDWLQKLGRNSMTIVESLGRSALFFTEVVQGLGVAF